MCKFFRHSFSSLNKNSKQPSLVYCCENIYKNYYEISTPSDRENQRLTNDLYSTNKQYYTWQIKRCYLVKLFSICMYANDFVSVFCCC